jgi:multidrug resistance efflux pump
MNKKQIGTGIGVVLVLVILGYYGYLNYLAPLPPTPTATSQGEAADVPEVVSAEGQVEPANYVRMSFAAGGLVGEVQAVEGQQVEKGELLARLGDHSQIQASLAAAELQFVAAQQAYDALFDDLDVAQAAALKAVADGRAVVKDARRYLDNLQAPADTADIDQARANLTLAENRLEKAQEDFAPYENKPEDNLVRAALLSRLAQAQNDYDAALRLVNNLEGSADEIDIAQAEANLALLQAQLIQAEEDYSAMGDGPHPDTLEVVGAELEFARAQRTAAEEQLAQHELRAPFSGTVVSVEIKSGEFAPPGLAAITIADLSEWRIETTDLGESDVAALASGMQAQITLDAFPDVSLVGIVLEVGLMGEDSRGSVTYPVVIRFEAGDLPVRWGMTAFVEIKVP